MARTSLSEAVRRPTGVGERLDALGSAVSLATPVRRRPTWVLLGVGAGGVGDVAGGVGVRDERPTRCRSLSPRTTWRRVRCSAPATSGGRAVGARRTCGRCSPGQQDLIVGRAARGPIPAGTVLNTDLFAERAEVIPAGQVVVGVALEPGRRRRRGWRRAIGSMCWASRKTTAAPPRTRDGGGVDGGVGVVGGADRDGFATAAKVWVSLLVPVGCTAGGGAGGGGWPVAARRLVGAPG